MNPVTKYNHDRISWELWETAAGRAYYGSALYAAKDMPCIVVNHDIRAAVLRYLRGRGAIMATDHILLFEAAMLVRDSGHVNPVTR